MGSHWVLCKHDEYDEYIRTVCFVRIRCVYIRYGVNYIITKHITVEVLKYG